MDIKRENIFIISAILIFCTAISHYMLYIVHHLFLLCFILSLIFLHKSKVSSKYGFPILFIALWACMDAATFAPPMKYLPCGCLELFAVRCPHAEGERYEVTTDMFAVDLPLIYLISPARKYGSNIQSEDDVSEHVRSFTPETIEELSKLASKIKARNDYSEIKNWLDYNQDHYLKQGKKNATVESVYFLIKILESLDLELSDRVVH